MGSLVDKLQYTTEAKAGIQEAIIEQGQECPGDLPLADYAERIRSIQGGGSTVIVTPIIEEGTKIATISVDGEDFDLFSPAEELTYEETLSILNSEE